MTKGNTTRAGRSRIRKGETMTRVFKLEDCFKSYTLDQDKAASPEATVLRVRNRLAELGLNVLERTERVDNGRLDIPVYVSVCGPDALDVMPTRKQMGKGATPAQAEASAVMEMVERFSFFHFVKNAPFVRAPYDQVRDRAMPFDQIAAAVHHPANDLDRALEAFSQLELSWIPAFDLASGRSAWVPFDWFYEINEFNGPAAGNRLEEALIQGLGEVVERHVSALVARGRLVLPSIDPESLASPTARELVEKFRRQGIRFYIKDFTLGMGMPTIGAMAYDPATFPEKSEIVYTAGTATDPEKAVIRALTEVAQLAGDFNTRANFVASGLPKYTHLDQAEYLTRPVETIPITALPNPSHANIRVEVETVVASLAAAGFPSWVVDVTHPGLGVPAVYTLMPGAHFRERARGASVPFFAAKIVAKSQDDPARVAGGLARLGRLYPNAYYLRFHQAVALIEMERPAEAAGLLEEALKGNPPAEDQAGILTYLGLARKDLEDYSGAVEALQASADIDPERRDTFNLLGFCHFKTKRHEQAIQAFEQVLRLDPGSGIDYANIGANYKALGQRDQAAAYFKTALEIDPSLTWVWDALDSLT
jgi:ribosomal protein S12 methylthiotransferase accessory factor